LNWKFGSFWGTLEMAFQSYFLVQNIVRLVPLFQIFAQFLALVILEIFDIFWREIQIFFHPLDFLKVKDD
jgi:hypothetical protein